MALLSTIKFDNNEFKQRGYIYDEAFVSQNYTSEQKIIIKNIPCLNCHSSKYCQNVESNPNEYENKVVSPIRRCTKQAIRDSLNEVDIASKRILEIGCGNWDFAKNNIEERQALWTGIDVYKSEVTSVIYNGIDLPFADESFDGIIANQVLEHVHDSTKTSPGNVIGQWIRVLKKGGFFFANVPIHLHGSLNFRFGNLDSLIQMFPPCRFSQVKIVYYRRDYSGMAPARILIDYSVGGWISAKYPYVSDLDTWKRKPVKQKIKIRLAQVGSILIDFILRQFHSIPFTIMTENPYLKNSYVIDFRAIKA